LIDTEAIDGWKNDAGRATDNTSVVDTSVERGGVAGTGIRWKSDTRSAPVDTSIVSIGADDSG
jgi:hypothetical protein